MALPVIEISLSSALLCPVSAVHLTLSHSGAAQSVSLCLTNACNVLSRPLVSADCGPGRPAAAATGTAAAGTGRAALPLATCGPAAPSQQMFQTFARPGAHHYTTN